LKLPADQNVPIRKTIMRNKTLFLLCLILLSFGMMGNDSCENSSSRSRQSTSFGVEQGQRPVNPIPEPTAALVFGAGLIVAAVAIRRRKP
jgi:hypothetical protein